MKVDEGAWKELLKQNLPAIVWIQRGTSWSNKGFNYAAFRVNERRQWYLAGAAEWYGQRECSDEEMLSILQRDDSVNWWYVSKWDIGN